MERDTVLVVDDDPDLLEVLAECLHVMHEWRVVKADGVESATVMLRAEINRIAVIICDDHMGGRGGNGVDFYFQRSLDLEMHGIPFVLMSGSLNREFQMTAMSFGMTPMPKPLPFGKMGEILRELIAAAHPPTDRGNPGEL